MDSMPQCHIAYVTCVHLGNLQVYAGGDAGGEDAMEHACMAKTLLMHMYTRRELPQFTKAVGYNSGRA